MSVLKIGDTLALGNDNIIRVTKTLEYNNESYVYAVSCPDNLKEALDINNLEHTFLKEVLDKDSLQLYLTKVQDSTTLDALKLMV